MNRKRGTNISIFDVMTITHRLDNIDKSICTFNHCGITVDLQQLGDEMWSHMNDTSIYASERIDLLSNLGFFRTLTLQTKTFCRGYFCCHDMVHQIRGNNNNTSHTPAVFSIFSKRYIYQRTLYFSINMFDSDDQTGICESLAKQF